MCKYFTHRLKYELNIFFILSLYCTNKYELNTALGAKEVEFYDMLILSSTSEISGSSHCLYMNAISIFLLLKQQNTEEVQ